NSSWRKPQVQVRAALIHPERGRERVPPYGSDRISRRAYSGSATRSALVALRVGDFRTCGDHRVLAAYGRGRKERTVPLHLEPVERLNLWIDGAGFRSGRDGALFRPV